MEYRALMCADCPEHLAIAAMITSDVPLGPKLPLPTADASIELNSSDFEAHSMSMEGADHVEVTATQIITHHETFARFAANPTITTIRSGSWSDPVTWSAGRIPVSGDRVNIPEGFTVTYAQVSNANIDALEISGTLNFANNQNTRLKAGDIQVLPTGTLRIGSTANPISSQFTAELIIADKPLSTGTAANPGVDPKQLGTALIVLGTFDVHGSAKDRTWVRLAAEPRAGDTSILLEQPVNGWRIGETLIFPDSRQAPSTILDAFMHNQYELQYEEITISQMLGNRIYLSRPLQFDHLGARNSTGQLELLPHVGVLDRNVVIQSENPAGTRGHTMFLGRANIDVEYARFKDLGRTDAMRPLNNTTVVNGQITAIGTNQIGRYPIHTHHLIGPENPTNTGYQYKLIGNTIDHSKKWAITIHDTAYGLIQDNVMYDAQGTGFMAEDGSEIENVIDRNFTMRISGTQDEGTDGTAGTAINDLARAGSGFWFRRSGNIVTNNVAADSVYAGYVFNGYHLWNDVTLPAFRGADKTVMGEGIATKLNPPGVFQNNEAYGMSRHGMWSVYLAGDNLLENHPTTVIKDLRLWNTGLVSGVVAYHTANLTFDNLLLLNDANAANRPDTGPLGMNFARYENLNLVIKNSRIEGFRYGIDAPLADATAPGRSAPTIIRDSTLLNYINFRVQPILDESPTGGNGVELRNVRFKRLTNVPPVTTYYAGPAYDIVMNYLPALANLTRLSTVKVYDYNGVPGSNFQVYYKEQRPNFVMPTTPQQALWGRDRFTVGSPEAGLTNQQNWDKYGIAMFGAVAPTTDETSRPEIFGYTSPILSPANPRVVFVTPWQGGGIIAGQPVRVRYTVNGELPVGSKVFFDLDGTREFDKLPDGVLFDVAEGAHELKAYIGDALTGTQIPGTDLTSVQFYIGGNWVYPLADILDVSPDPRSAPVDDMTVHFTHPMRGIDLSDLTLTRDGGPNLLTGAQTLTTTDTYTWKLNNLNSLTRLPGKYVLTVADKAGVTGAGYQLALPATESFTVGNVVARHVFYNGSAFDGNNAGIDLLDDLAIAPDKTALLPGETATFANYTSYSRGLNGIMIDVRNLPGTPTAEDFIFRAGNTATPQSWLTVAAVPTISMRRGAGLDGSDRITITWPDSAIRSQWLQVTLKPTAATGLLGADVFYFGNAIGETGNSTVNSQVSASDEIYARNTPKTIVNPALITDRADFNRDRFVSAVDQIIARNNRTTLATQLVLLSAPSLSLVPAGMTASAQTDSKISASMSGNISNEAAESTGVDVDAALPKRTTSLLTPQAISTELSMAHAETLHDNNASTDKTTSKAKSLDALLKLIALDRLRT